MQEVKQNELIRYPDATLYAGDLFVIEGVFEPPLIRVGHNTWRKNYKRFVATAQSNKDEDVFLYPPCIPDGRFKNANRKAPFRGSTLPAALRHQMRFAPEQKHVYLTRMEERRWPLAYENN